MKSLIVFISLVTLLIAVICIYGARGIVSKRVNKEDENKVVLGMKVVSFIFALISLGILCYLK